MLLLNVKVNLINNKIFQKSIFSLEALHNDNYTADSIDGKFIL
jgi:hypothetical protein